MTVARKGGMSCYSLALLDSSPRTIRPQIPIPKILPTSGSSRTSHSYTVLRFLSPWPFLALAPSLP